ncbi:hypothetical protein SAY87_010121 [Trapa incisa]|uniref:Uncharacterized protein n=1 Tax=Trapa incisa TaxID=236973 RepID=A0AAN7GL15_9MYRT|nr:hypothetical protein SAY87_010121 [Trapa incisa]
MLEDKTPWPCTGSLSVSLADIHFTTEKSQPFSGDRNFLAENLKMSPLVYRICRAIRLLERLAHILLQTVWNVGKDGIEAGTNLVPDSIPRPIARISVTVVTLTLSIFVLKSFLSTAFFVLGTMGLVYFIYLAFNKDNGPRGGGGGSSSSSNTSVDESLEEARRIMEKYK